MAVMSERWRVLLPLLTGWLLIFGYFGSLLWILKLFSLGKFIPSLVGQGRRLRLAILCACGLTSVYLPCSDHWASPGLLEVVRVLGYNANCLDIYCIWSTIIWSLLSLVHQPVTGLLQYTAAELLLLHLHLSAPPPAGLHLHPGHRSPAPPEIYPPRVPPELSSGHLENNKLHLVQLSSPST